MGADCSTAADGCARQAGNVHGSKVAQRFIEAMPPSSELVADKGYDSQTLREWLDERGTEAVIPPRKCGSASRTGKEWPK